MPDTDATASARGGVRAVAKLDQTLSSLTTDDATGAALSAATNDASANRPQEQSSTDTLVHQEPRALTPNVANSPVLDVDLKLLVDADRLADFADAPVIAANARNKGARKHLKSVYYDTAERTLWRNGVSLRVRQSGNRFVQTVSIERGDTSARGSTTDSSVSSLAPDLALAMPALPEDLRADLERNALEIVFTADIHRHQRFVDLPSGTVQVAFDHGTITADHRTRPVSEIALELKTGNAAAIYQLALRLAEQGSLRPSIRSEAAHGFDLAEDKPPTVRKPSRLKLAPEVALDDSFSIILRGCFQHLLQAMPAAEDGRNPEGVHQLRVALRRLRAALHLMQSVGSWSQCDLLRNEARWLGQSLSAARDWDIFLTETLPVVAKGCPTLGGFNALEKIAERQRTTSYRKIRTALADRRCANFVLGLGEWIETRGWRSDVSPETLGQLAEPAVNFAGRILSVRHDKVLKRGRRFKSQPAEKRHEVRLLLKKLRYSVDFLLPLYGDRKSARKYAARLAGLQEELGCYNDMAVTAGLLAGLDVDSTDSATAAAAITGWQAHAMVGVEAPLRKAWRSFVDTPTPWAREGES